MGGGAAGAAAAAAMVMAGQGQNGIAAGPQQPIFGNQFQSQAGTYTGVTCVKW